MGRTAIAEGEVLTGPTWTVGIWGMMELLEDDEEPPLGPDELDELVQETRSDRNC